MPPTQTSIFFSVFTHSPVLTHTSLTYPLSTCGHSSSVSCPQLLSPDVHILYLDVQLSSQNDLPSVKFLTPTLIFVSSGIKSIFPVAQTEALASSSASLLASSSKSPILLLPPHYRNHNFLLCYMWVPYYFPYRTRLVSLNR